MLLLRRFYQGLLLVGETFEKRRYVMDPASGSLVTPMPESWRGGRRIMAGEEGAELSFFVPEDCDDGLQLLVVPEPIDDLSEAADRWRVYHGKPDGPRWVRLKVEQAKWSGGVCMGDELCCANPIKGAEARLCRELNGDGARLARLCERANGVRPESPVAVGVDTWGVDVRSSLGVVRVEFGGECGGEGEVRAVLERLGGA